jgi:hypothetical protein
VQKAFHRRGGSLRGRRGGVSWGAAAAVLSPSTPSALRPPEDIDRRKGMDAWQIGNLPIEIVLDAIAMDAIIGYRLSERLSSRARHPRKGEKK